MTSRIEELQQGLAQLLEGGISLHPSNFDYHVYLNISTLLQQVYFKQHGTYHQRVLDYYFEKEAFELLMSKVENLFWFVTLIKSIIPNKGENRFNVANITYAIEQKRWEYSERIPSKHWNKESLNLEYALERKHLSIREMKYINSLSLKAQHLGILLYDDNHDQLILNKIFS